MIRILRLKKDLLSADSQSCALSSDAWREELSSALGAETAGILARACADGDYVNYYTDYAGAPEKSDGNLNAQVQGLLDTRVQKILNYLEDKSKPLLNPNLEDRREGLARLIRERRHLILMDRRNPVILPYLTPEEHDAALKAEKLAEEARLKAVTPAVSSGRRFPRGLLAALLLLLLLPGLLWWFLLRPWPMEGTLTGRLNELMRGWGLNGLFREDYTKQTRTLNDIQAQADKMLAELSAREKAAAEEAARLAAEEEAKRKAEEEAKLKEAEEARQKALEELERLKAEQEAREKAEAEARAKAEAEAKAQAEAAARKKTAARKKPEETKLKPETAKSGSKKLPRCETLKQQGAMPRMVVAFDGSGSMRARDVASSSGRKSRLEVAHAAAGQMVQGIDKNVNIGLVDIRGCPSATNHGFYSGGQRAALVTKINSIRPGFLKNDTPLISGLRTMASMVDGVSAEAVGVLISDGEDSCLTTMHLNVCDVARDIHARKPKLKIHAILIGQASYKAACVAQITGGKVFKPRDASQINAQLAEAGAEYKQVCTE